MGRSRDTSCRWRKSRPSPTSTTGACPTGPTGEPCPPARSPAWYRATSKSRFNREVPELFLALMPPFPLGTRVVIEDGRWRGYTAVVAALDRLAPRRPVVRVIADEHGGRVAPHEIDLARELIPVSGFEARSRALA